MDVKMRVGDWFNVSPVTPRQAAMILRGGHPIALGLLLSGTFYFYLMADWFGIAHPAWYVWGWVAVSTASYWQRYWQLMKSRLTLVDVAIGGFVAVVLISAAVQTSQDFVQASRLLCMYLLFPYAAARVLNPAEIRLLLKTCAVLGFIAIPLSIIELTNLDPKELMDDRIKSFLGGYYTLNETGMLLGSYLVIAGAAMFALEKEMTVKLRTFVLLSIAACSAVMTVLGTRGGLVASLVVGVMILSLPWRASVSYRAAVFAFMVIPVLAAYVNVSESRKGFYVELVRPFMRGGGTDLVTTRRAGDSPMYSGWWPEANAPPGKSEQVVMARGTGSSTWLRSLLLRDALTSFSEYPLMGVGVGNFGKYSPTVRTQSENSFCYTGTSREGNVHTYRCVQSVRFTSPHSSTLHVLSELGLVGIAFYSLLLGVCLGWLWKRAWSRGVISNAGPVAVLGILWVFYLGMDQIYGSYLHGFRFYILTGCVAALIVSARRELQVGNDAELEAHPR
jgi:hypothetical protein